MQVKSGSLLLLSFLLLSFGQVHSQTARVVFFKTGTPFPGSLYHHKVKITDAQEGQYARPHTTYGYKYIQVGKLTPSTALVYDYAAPTPAFYMGQDKRDQFTPSQPVQFVAVKTRYTLFPSHYSFQTYTQEQFKQLYNSNEHLRKQLLKCGYHSVDELLQLQTATGS